MGRAGSGSSSSATKGTIEYNYTKVGDRSPVSIPRYGPSVLKYRSIGLLLRFLGQLMVAQRDGFNQSINGARLELQGWLLEVAERLVRSDQIQEFVYLRPHRTFDKNAHFGLEDIVVKLCTAMRE